MPPDTTTEPQATETQQRGFGALAAEMYGSQFRGEAPPETQIPDADEPGRELEPAEEHPEPALDGDDASESEAVEISSLDQLTEHYQLDPEWVRGLKIRGKVNGESVETTISDLVASFQMREAAEQRLAEAKTNAKAIAEQAQAKFEGINQHYAIVGRLIQEAEKNLNLEIAEANLAQLREEDPGEYAARKADFSEKRARLDGLKREASASFAEVQDQRVSETQAKVAEHRIAQRAALIEKIPEWSDPSKERAGKAEVVEYLVTSPGLQFSRDEVREDVLSILDHRLLILARKAMAYDKLQEKAGAAAKRVVMVPKVLKPGVPKPQEQATQEQRAKLRDRLRKTGKLKDAFALLRTR